jgi:hypothetical protein
MSPNFRPLPAPGRPWPLVGGAFAAALLGASVVVLFQPRPVEAVPEPPPLSVKALPSPEPVVAPSVPAEPDVAAVEPAAAEEPPSPASLELTALDENEAARVLAQAWRATIGTPPTARTLAILWAHWAHETGRGRRMVGHNFGGLKGAGPSGASVLAWTREGPEFERIVLRKFRAYPDFPEGASDYVTLLHSRYPRALRAAKNGDVVQFADALATAGYFTDEPSAYRRALARLALECLERTIPEAALLALDES